MNNAANVNKYSHRAASSPALELGQNMLWSETERMLLPKSYGVCLYTLHPLETYDVIFLFVYG